MEKTRPEILSTPLTVRRGELALGIRGLTVAMGSVGYFTSHYDRRDPSSTLHAETLFVAPAYRGHGVGEMLLRRLIHEGQQLKLDDLEAKITSEYALDIRARVFGKEALHITHSESFPPLPLPTLSEPIQFDDARAWLVEAGAYTNKSARFRQHGFDVFASMRDVDTTSND